MGLLHCLDYVRICSGIKDRRIWVHDISGCFLCKSAFVQSLPNNDFQVFPPANLLLEDSLSIQSQGVHVAFSFGQIECSRSSSRRRPFQVLSLRWRVLCRMERESISFSFKLWCKVLKEFGVSQVTSSSSKLLGLGHGLVSKER